MDLICWCVFDSCVVNRSVLCFREGPGSVFQKNARGGELYFTLPVGWGVVGHEEMSIENKFNFLMLDK